jgi:hypothetical protein
MKLIPIAVILILLTGAFTSSCRHYPTTPNDSTKCDTCCDTCHTDTTPHPPCDTCNKSDTTSHNFEWTEYTIPSQSNISGIAVYGPNLIYAFHDKLYIFNGTTWIETKVTINGKSYLPLFTDGYVFGMSQEEYWVTVGGSIIYHGKKNKVDEFRLDQIRIMNYPIDGAVRSCWGPSSTDMFFVGDTGTIFHYDGTNWTKFPKPTTKDLRSIWGTSHSDIWAGGFNRQTGKSALLHFDGSSWTNIDLATVGSFECAGCDGISSVWACDSLGHHLGYVGGSLFYRRTDNSLWTNDSNRVGNKFNDNSYAGISIIRGNGPNDILCVSDWGFISHWNGKTWKRYDNLYNPQNFNYGTNGMSFVGNTACVVGFKDGQSWVAVGRRKK